MATGDSQAAFDITYQTLRKSVQEQTCKNIKWRKWQLKQLYWLLDENESAFVRALADDLHRSTFEALMSDINETKHAILVTLKQIDSWARGNAPPSAGWIFGTFGGAWIRKEPLGLVLIIGAWNYPLSTLLVPAVAAIAAGNAAVLKPSDISTHVTQLLSKLAPNYLDTSAIAVIDAAPAEMSHILKCKFDFIFYTGSTRVGRIIATAAAQHITPTALELGGLAPAIVSKHADVDLAAKRLISAKLYNLGQICICVNHAFVEPEVYDELISRMKFWAQEFLKDGGESLARIITPKHCERLLGLLRDTNGRTVFTGPHDKDDKLVYPTVVADVTMSDSLLSEELFGPILPLIKADVATALDTINSMPHPLGLYIFSNSRQEVENILDSTQSGGVTINDVALHAEVPSAPFGGVGDSGHGSYHGKWGFDAFSHNRTTVRVPKWFDWFAAWRYPPFDIANKSEIDPGRAKFRKGETMEEQKVSRESWLSMSWLW